MMKQLTIDNSEFARSQQTLAANLDVTDCDRLLAQLSTEEGAKSPIIAYQLIGFKQKFSYPSLHLNIEASLPVRCQRCLEIMDIQLDLAFDYLISDQETIEADENDEMDWLEAAPEMDVALLVEDELLLAMPFAPTHAHDCAQMKFESGEKANPFAVLQNLGKKKT